MSITRLDLSSLALILLLAAPLPVQAEAFPNRNITLVVGLASGSVQDAAARILARQASPLLGVQIIVENKPGAGTMNASLSVARAPADGYTLLQNGVALSVNPSLYKQVPYDAANDFTPVAYLVSAPQILVVNPSLGVSTLKEFLTKFKQSDSLNFASPGAGTMPHLAAELFRSRSGIAMRHVPYRGGGPALTDVIAGHVDLTFITPVARSHVESGEVVALAAAAEHRLETLPNVPTFAEAGLPLPEINAGAWFGVLAPKGTPPDIVHKLNTTFNTVLEAPETLAEIKALGLVPKPMTPEEFGAFMRDDMKRWPPIIAAAGIKAE